MHQIHQGVMQKLWCMHDCCPKKELLCFLLTLKPELLRRFSPKEWKLEGNLGTTAVANSFSLMNSLWFALGALMQQVIEKYT